MNYDYDLIIVGGGPAGSTMALYAAKHGLNVLLVDKEQFPRDKVCGDAIPQPCMRILREFDLTDALLQEPHSLVTHLVLYSERERLRLPYNPDPLIISRRTIFDNILFQAAKATVDTREEWGVEDLLVKDGQVFGIQGRSQSGKSLKYTAKVVAGADGFRSIVARKLGIYKYDRQHWAVATRAYYRRMPIAGNEIELHYYKESIPGYLWVFPVNHEMVNVGVIVFPDTLKDSGFSLRKLHCQLPQSPLLKKRFERAELIGEIKGWNLPLASVRRTMHGNGFILAGDAAGLVDPLFGHGIDTAMKSGKIAGEVLAAICRGDNYSAEVLQEYADAVWNGLGTDFKFNSLFRKRLQLVFSSPVMTPIEKFHRLYFRGGGVFAKRTDMEVRNLQMSE